MSKIITYLQLRAARQVLNLGVRDIAKVLKVSKATISKSELDKTRDFFYKNSAALIEFFEQKNIIFPNEYSIRYNWNVCETKFLDGSDNNITRFQLKAARHILNISQNELAKLVNTDKGIISRAEQFPNEYLIKPQNPTIVVALKLLFQQYNIEFPDHLSIFFKKYVDNKSNR